MAWVDRIKGLGHAEASVVRWGEASRGNYIIFDVRERIVVLGRGVRRQYLGAEERTAHISRCDEGQPYLSFADLR